MLLWRRLLIVQNTNESIPILTGTGVYQRQTQPDDSSPSCCGSDQAPWLTRADHLTSVQEPTSPQAAGRRPESYLAEQRDCFHHQKQQQLVDLKWQMWCDRSRELCPSTMHTPRNLQHQVVSACHSKRLPELRIGLKMGLVLKSESSTTGFCKPPQNGGPESHKWLISSVAGSKLWF